MESFIVVPGSCPFTISGGSALWGRRDLRTVPRTGAARGSRPESGPARAFKHSRRRVGPTARCVDLRLGFGARQRPAAVPCGGPMPPDGLRSCQPPQHDRGGSTQTDRVNTIGLMYLASHRISLNINAASLATWWPSIDAASASDSKHGRPALARRRGHLRGGREEAETVARRALVLEEDRRPQGRRRKKAPRAAERPRPAKRGRSTRPRTRRARGSGARR